MVTPMWGGGGGEERDIDFGNMTDDGEVEFNLPREDAMERDPPGEDVRDLPGPPLRLEFLNGARTKWPARVGHFLLSRSPIVRGRELQWMWMVPG